MSPKRREYVKCPRCGNDGQSGPPGLKVSDYEHLEAVSVPVDGGGFANLIGDDLPVRVTCQACGKSWPMNRHQVRVEKRKP